MKNNMYIDSDALVSIAKSLKNKSESIIERYQEDCQVALRMGMDCIKLSGLDVDELNRFLNGIYQQLGERLINLAEFLTSTSMQYETLMQTIANNFNSNLKAQMTNLMNTNNTSVQNIGD